MSCWKRFGAVLVNGQDAWLITVSIPSPLRTSPFGKLSELGNVRDYKTVAVSRDTGEFLEMTIRSLPAQD
jgi:hypothetical protein